MLYLLLAILCSASVSVLMHFSERHGKGRIGMLLVNYIVCSGLGLCFAGFSEEPGAGAAIGLGIGCGVIYLVGFLLMQYCIGRSGVILPSTFMKLGVMVPAILSMTVFGEGVRAVRLIGMALAAAAIVLMNRREKGSKMEGLGFLILLLFAGGSADGMSKVYSYFGTEAHRGLFLLTTFFTSAVLCTGVTIAKKQRITRMDWLDGFLIAVPNYFCSRFLLLSLASVPAAAAYPTFSVATIACVSLAGLILFKERLTRRQWLAMGVIAAALILLNI